MTDYIHRGTPVRVLGPGPLVNHVGYVQDSSSSGSGPLKNEIAVRSYRVLITHRFPRHSGQAEPEMVMQIDAWIIESQLEVVDPTTNL